MFIGKYDGFESKAEFYIVDGKIVEIRIKSIKDRKPLSGSKLKDFKVFLEEYKVLFLLKNQTS